MSFTIHSKDAKPVFTYAEDPKPTITFHNKLLEADVGNQITIPFHLQASYGERTFINYPPEEKDVKIFAQIYREVIFEGELLKHGYYVTEAEKLHPSKKV